MSSDPVLLFIVLSILPLVNILTGILAAADSIQDASMKKLAHSLPHVVMSALAPSTNYHYGRGWGKWVEWTNEETEVTALPADPFHVAIYLNFLLQTNGTVGALKTAAYGIRWARHAAGFPSPTARSVRHASA